MPGEPDAWPKADVIVVAPATFNTVNSWALGLTHDFVVGVVVEGIGKGIPIVAMPCVNSAYVQHRQFERSIEELRAMGVQLLYGDSGFVPNQPGQGKPKEFPRALVLDAAVDAMCTRSTQPASPAAGDRRLCATPHFPPHPIITPTTNALPFDPRPHTRDRPNHPHPLGQCPPPTQMAR